MDPVLHLHGTMRPHFDGFSAIREDTCIYYIQDPKYCHSVLPGVDQNLVILNSVDDGNIM